MGAFARGLQLEGGVHCGSQKRTVGSEWGSPASRPTCPSPEPIRRLRSPRAARLPSSRITGGRVCRVERIFAVFVAEARSFASSWLPGPVMRESTAQPATELALLGGAGSGDGKFKSSLTSDRTGKDHYQNGLGGGDSRGPAISCVGGVNATRCRLTEVPHVRRPPLG
jgi:hypothetical protein